MRLLNKIVFSSIIFVDNFRCLNSYNNFNFNKQFNDYDYINSTTNDVVIEYNN